MPKAIIGKKIGMTQIFDEAGRAVPVTVIEAGPCVVVQKRTVENDGYSAVQLGYGEQKEHRVNKPLLGHFRAAGVKPVRYLREVRVVDGDPLASLDVGAEVKADLFEAGEYVDVTGVSKGKGFAGTVKRHNFSPWRDDAGLPLSSWSGLPGRDRTGAGVSRAQAAGAHGRRTADRSRTESDSG